MKSQKSFRALLMVLFAALLLNGCGGGDSYETFSLTMNKLAGEGQWSDKGHSTSFFGGELTVEGLTVNSETGTVEIATVMVKEPLAKEEMQSILEAKDWKDRKETVIAEALVLKGIKRTLKQGEDLTMTSTMDEINMAALALTAADSNALAGLPGFLKAARVGKITYSNFKGTATGNGADMEMSLALMNAEGLAFNAEPMPGLDLLESGALSTGLSEPMPSGLLTVLSSFSADTLSFKDMAMNATMTKNPDNPGKVAFSLAAVDMKGLKGPFRAASVWSMTGLKMTMTDDEGMDAKFALESLAFNDVDMSEYYAKFMPLIAASMTGDGDVEEAVNSVQTFADFFVSPITLKDASLKGLDIQVGKFFGLKTAEAIITGPLAAGSIAPKQSSAITGLEIILPESPEGLDDSALEVYQFAQDFGLSRFVVDMATESTYDPATGRLSASTSKFAFRDLMDLKMNLNMGGLTAERLNVLKTVSLNDALMALMDPAGIFGELSIENMDITLSNLGLVERIYTYVGKTQMSGAPADQVKAMASGGAKMALAVKGAEYLEAPELLGNSLAAFLQDPKSLQVTLKAEPPLSVISAQGYAGDSNRMLNSLNLTVTANGETGVQPLRFNIPGVSPAAPVIEEEAGETQE